MKDSKTNPGIPEGPGGTKRVPRSPLPTDSPTEREEWARWVENLGAHFSGLLIREQEYLRANPDDKQARESVSYYRHAVGLARWFAYRIRAGRLRPPL